MRGNPIAVIHEIVGPTAEWVTPVYSQQELDKKSKELKRDNAVYYVCLCGAAPPTKALRMAR